MLAVVYACANSYAVLAFLWLLSHAIVELHCHNIKTVGFAGECLFSAAEDEVAQWQMDL